MGPVTPGMIADFVRRRSRSTSRSRPRRSTNSSRYNASSSAIAIIGPSGVSIHVARSTWLSSRRVGAAPIIREKASRNPLLDSYPVESWASMTGRPERMFPSARPMRRARAYSTKVMPKRFLNWRRAVDASTDSCRKSSSLQRFSGLASTASTSWRTKSDTRFGWDKGRQR
ncbi:hypothetical protein D3C76_1096850 [compost metagenome]